MKSALLIFLILAGPITPGEIFSDGEKELSNKNWEKASAKFSEAIDTGELNLAGKSMAYWNIYISEYSLGNTDKSMHALLGFIVYGTEAIESESPFYINWAKNSKLDERLFYAVALIQAKWASKNDYSCREEIFSCYVPKENYITLFEETIPFCNGRKAMDMRVIRKNKLLILNVFCKLEDLETYYFRTSNEL